MRTAVAAAAAAGMAALTLITSGFSVIEQPGTGNCGRSLGYHQVSISHSDGDVLVRGPC